MLLRHLFCILTLLVSCSFLCVLAEAVEPDSLAPDVATACPEASDGPAKPPCSREEPGDGGGGLGGEVSQLPHTKKSTKHQEGSGLPGESKEQTQVISIPLSDPLQQETLPHNDDHSSRSVGAGAAAGAKADVVVGSQGLAKGTETPVAQKAPNTLTDQSVTSKTVLENSNLQPGEKDKEAMPADASSKMDLGPSRNGPQPATTVEGTSHSDSEPNTSDTRTSENAETTPTN
ncbi:uncharacterized protein TM35_000761090, partial [Trypanosoma theileri]